MIREAFLRKWHLRWVQVARRGQWGRQLHTERKANTDEVGKWCCMVRPLKMAVLLFLVHPLPDQGPLHLYPMHVTDLPTYLPHAPAGDCSYQRGGEGRTLLLISLVTVSPPDVNSPVTGSLPFPLGAKTAAASCLLSASHGECRSRTLLQTCKLPHPLNHWRLCCWLQVLQLLQSWSWASTRLVGLWGAAQQLVYWTNRR